MTIKTRLDPVGNFSIVRDSIRVMETQPALKTFCLAPGGKLLLENYSFSYAQPRLDNWYSYTHPVAIGTDPFTGNTQYEGGCASYTAIVAEEWGPGRTQNIDDVLLGTMPAYTEYVDVRVKLTRTSAPDSIFGNPLPTACKGEWMSLEGGALVIEGWPAYFIREMEIVLDHPGEAVVRAYLRRKTSIRRLSLPTVGSISTTGWTVLVSSLGLFANLVSNQDPSFFSSTGGPPSNWLQRGGFNGCSQGTSGNWSSSYNGIIEITPGRVSAAS